MFPLKGHNDGDRRRAAAAGGGGDGDICEDGGPLPREHDRRGPLPLPAAAVVDLGYVAASAGPDGRAVLGTCMPVALHTCQFSGLLADAIFKIIFVPDWFNPSAGQK